MKYKDFLKHFNLEENKFYALKKDGWSVNKPKDLFKFLKDKEDSLQEEDLDNLVFVESTDLTRDSLCAMLEEKGTCDDIDDMENEYLDENNLIIESQTDDIYKIIGETK